MYFGFLTYWQDVQHRLLKSMVEIHRPRKKPDWTTPSRVDLDLDGVLLRCFGEGNSDTALFIIPPQAGHHSCIADYGEGQSLVEAALKAGIQSVYALECKSATFERRNDGIEEYILSMKQCIEKIGRKVVLVGLCQGGWQAAIYAALFPEDIESLVLAGAPIDFHAGDSKISRYASVLPTSFYQSLVAMGNGLLDGKFLLTGFKMMNPEVHFWGDYWNLFSKIHNEEYLERSRKFREWYEYTQKLPGKFYLQAVVDLFKRNKLVRKELRILGEKVDLARISCPVFLIAGDKDDITPPDQLFAVEKHVSSQTIRKWLVSAGHIGLFMGSQIIKKIWPEIFQAIIAATTPKMAMSAVPAAVQSSTVINRSFLRRMS